MPLCNEQPSLGCRMYFCGLRAALPVVFCYCLRGAERARTEMLLSI